MSTEEGTAEGTETTAETQETTMTKEEPMALDKWRDTIPEDIRNNKTIQETPDITTMAKRLVDANNYISQSIRLPDDGDTSGMDELYNKLGRPESADKYKVTRPDLKEGDEYNEEIETAFLEAAHNAGLNNSQVNKLMTWNEEQRQGQQKIQHENSAKAISDLKTEWGNAFDERVNMVNEVLNQYGDDQSEATIKNNAGLISLIYELGKGQVEGTTTGEGNVSHARSPQEAQAEIDKLNRDPEFKKAYYSKNDPTHGAAVAQMQTLMAEAHPEPEKMVL